MNVDREAFKELAAAVYAGDTAKACTILDLMRAAGSEGVAEVIMRASRAARPLPNAQPLDKPIVLPAPHGVDPRAYFGGPPADSPRIRSFGA
jgi:hypothetical protein